jgi:predicted ATPase
MADRESVTQPVELSEAEEAFRALLGAPRAYSAWARQVRLEWEARSEADAVRAVALAQAEARRVEEKQGRKNGKGQEKL